MKPFTSKHMFGASCKSSSPLKKTDPPKKTKGDPPKTNIKTKEAYANISSKSATQMNSEIDENKKRVLIEAQAKNDSVSGARARKLSGGNLFQQGMAGNKAANKTRKAGGAGDMTVLRGKSTGSGGFLSEGDVTYTRDKPVEKDFTKMRKNPKTGKY
jgi:hypothetical protein